MNHCGRNTISDDAIRTQLLPTHESQAGQHNNSLGIYPWTVFSGWNHRDFVRCFWVSEKIFPDEKIITVRYF